MTESLKEKTVSGLKWTGIEKLFLYIFVFFAGIFLNRKLFDEDYGLVAVLSIFTYLANALQDSGFPQALIRKKDVTEADYNTVFYFSISIGIFLYTVLFFCAPLIADSYNEPKLVNLSRFIFLSFVFNAFSSVQSTQITKSVNYKLNTKISIASTILSYSLAISLAFLGYGPWALASQMVALQGFRMIFLWIGNRWRPQLMFSIDSFKSLFGFGSNLLLKSILDTISTRITPNIIGRYLGLAQTGIYDNGNRWYGTCFDFVSGTILNVTYPILSKVDEGSEMTRIYRKIVRTTSFIVFPMFLGLFLIARPFMLITIGEKWAGSIGVLQILAIGGIFIALNALSMHIIKIKGKSSYILYTELIYTVL
ncbi:MAG: lipopolysaccharide biosynthesis protein, partial [Dysgonomonas sp.]